jgi:lysophospholipase L1-like esterase
MNAGRALAPQMADYDRMKLVWLPHVMYLQEPNFRSVVANTDDHGFRVSHDAEGQEVPLESFTGPACNLIVGNSTAFGVGARGDGTTLASDLARRTNELWFNLSGRSYSSTQELLLFQTYFETFRHVRRIVIFSGANDLILHYRSHHYPPRYGSFFFWRMYQRSMSFFSLSPNRRRIKTLLSPFYGDRIDYAGVSMKDLPLQLFGGGQSNQTSEGQWPGESITENRDAVVGWMRRDLALWRLLADAIGAEIHYVLQPLGGWVSKDWTEEETRLLEDVRQSSRKFNKVLSRELNEDVHRWFSGRLAAICGEQNIDFLDMNQAFSAAEPKDRWIFNDYIHLTDEGYALAGDIIARHIGQGAIAVQGQSHGRGAD